MNMRVGGFVIHYTAVSQAKVNLAKNFQHATQEGGYSLHCAKLLIDKMAKKIILNSLLWSN